MSNLPVSTPRVNRETKPFWDGTAQGRLVLPHCNACGFVIWYPRSRCPQCSSTDVRWEAVSGEGVIYSFSITPKGHGAYREAGPYVLAYVELDEGPRLMTNIVDCDPSRLTVGQRVKVCFDDTGEGTALYRFAPRSLTDMDLRSQLEDLARRLHLMDDDDNVTALRADVQRSLDEDDHEDLGDRLVESAVHFETAHPELAAVIRRVADALAASGM